jgi:hypothetical protein
MTNPYERFFDRPLVGIFGPLVWWRSYTNLFYLLIGFPLGLAYFVLYVTGFSLGLGLLVLGIGALILAVMILLARPLGIFERALANRLLGAGVPPIRRQPLPDDELRTWLEDVFTSPVTWKSLVFLSLKFPLGLASWIAVVVGLSVVLAFLAAPIVFAAGGELYLGFWEPATLRESFLLIPFGLVGYILAIHLFNGLAWAWGRFARLMLGVGAPSPPAAPVPVLHPAPVSA